VPPGVGTYAPRVVRLDSRGGDVIAVAKLVRTAGHGMAVRSGTANRRERGDRSSPTLPVGIWAKASALRTLAAGTDLLGDGVLPTYVLGARAEGTWGLATLIVSHGATVIRQGPVKQTEFAELDFTREVGVQVGVNSVQAEQHQRGHH
jgi:hypothetical protein